MLPPFRVRTLRLSARPGLERSKIKEFNALVRITAPEYDKTLRNCPEATLKYLDEEDGEIVTIGSSFELIQCLESPVQQNPHYIGLIPRVSSLLNRRDFSETLAAPAVHQRIFHIDCRPSTVQLWREIEERTKGINITLLPYNYSIEPQGKGLFRNPHGAQLAPASIPNLCSMNARRSSSMRDMMQGVAPESDLSVDASDDLLKLQEPEDYRITPLDASIGPDISQGQEAQSRNCPKNCPRDVVEVFFQPADSIARLQELSGYGLKPYLRTDFPATDDQVESNLKPSLKDSLLLNRDEQLISQQQHDAHTSSRSVGARDHPFEFNAASAHAPEAYSRDANDKQSLLNVFEAELARVPSPSAGTKNEENVDICDNVESAPKSKDQFNGSTQQNNNNLDQTGQTPAQACIQALELGLGAALSSFHACLNDIAESVQRASAAVHSADRSRIESTIASFRSFAHELAASAKVVEQTLKSDRGKLDQRKTITTTNKDNTRVEILSRKAQGQEVGGEPLRITTTREPKRDSATVETTGFKDVAFSGCSNSSLSSQHDAPFRMEAQDETTLPAEDRIAPRRNLNKPNMLKQACDDARDRNNPTSSKNYSRMGMHNASESFTETVYSGEELSKSAAIHKVIPRFPTFEQFEDGALATAHRFPPLPSMEALEPLRLNPLPRVPRRLNTRDGSSYIDQDSDHETSIPEPFGGTSVTLISDRSESSGEFFNRMTGLGKGPVTTTHSSLQASIGQDFTGLDGGLTQVGPFIGRKNVICRQSVSEPARNDSSINNSRRPYSENFSGEGRIGWDTFLRQGYESHNTNLGVVEPIPSSLTSERGRYLRSGISTISHHNVHNDEAASEIQRAEITQDSEQSNINQRGDAAYVRKVQACVTQLHKLGYGSDAAQGGFERLTVYAQAAEGDLIDAIDIIDEEQQAYKLALQVDGN